MCDFKSGLVLRDGTMWDSSQVGTMWDSSQVGMMGPDVTVNGKKKGTK